MARHAAVRGVGGSSGSPSTGGAAVLMATFFWFIAGLAVLTIVLRLLRII
jgi:hypothetical protein